MRAQSYGVSHSANPLYSPQSDPIDGLPLTLQSGLKHDAKIVPTQSIAAPTLPHSRASIRHW
jgi:hypothetical protein